MPAVETEDIQTIEYNPLDPYSRAPIPTIAAIRHDALNTAHGFFVSYYADRPELIRSADKALEALKTRPWTVLESGDLEIAGSSATYISGAECVKKGVYKTNKKTGRHSPTYCPSYNGGRGGRCYHQTAREIVRLAQVFMGVIE